MAAITTNDRTSLGELLRRAREHRGLTLEKVANETKIPHRHLEALEHDNLTAIPAGFYQRAEIRAYARAVGLDQHLALAELESALTPAAAPAPPRGLPRAHDPIRLRTYAVIVLTVTAAAAIAAAVFGRAIPEGTPALSNGAHIRSATDSPAKPLRPVRDASRDDRTSEREQSAPVESPALSQGTPAVSTEKTITELVVVTEPAGARITVNGVGWGTSPAAIRYLPPGDKRIRVSKEGYITEERVVRLAEGRRQAVEMRLNSAP
jgi:cytoskeletal protein RodZ